MVTLDSHGYGQPEPSRHTQHVGDSSAESNRFPKSRSHREPLAWLPRA